MKILVVGAGISGCVIARELAEKNIKCVVIDSRNHIGGNCYDYVNEHGIRVHKYGPHLFHTDNKEVFKWISNFTEITEYKHKVKALLNNGQYVTLPVNRETKDIVGEENIIDIFYRPYTRKMWGLEIEQIDKSIIDRVKVRDDYNEYYFPDDKFQFVPTNGYTEMFSNILNHHNIEIGLSIKFHKMYEGDYDHIFNSMSIDSYYDYKFGKLEYRGLSFENISLPFNKLLPTATVNFTHNGPETRITEWKNIPNHGKNENKTTLTVETPCNNGEKFYPIKDIENKNKEIYEKYKSLENKKTTFIGRCGTYKYIDMDEAVEEALKISKEFIIKNNLC